MALSLYIMFSYELLCLSCPMLHLILCYCAYFTRIKSEKDVLLCFYVMMTINRIELHSSNSSNGNGISIVLASSS